MIAKGSSALLIHIYVGKQVKVLAGDCVCAALPVNVIYGDCLEF